MSKMISTKKMIASLRKSHDEIQNEVFQRLEFGRGATDWQSETLSLIRHWIKRLSVYDQITWRGKLYCEMLADFHFQSASSYFPD